MALFKFGGLYCIKYSWRLVVLTLPFNATSRKPQADASLRLTLWGPLPFAGAYPVTSWHHEEVVIGLTLNTTFYLCADSILFVN